MVCDTVLPNGSPKFVSGHTLFYCPPNIFLLLLQVSSLALVILQFLTTLRFISGYRSLIEDRRLSQRRPSNIVLKNAWIYKQPVNTVKETTHEQSLQAQLFAAGISETLAYCAWPLLRPIQPPSFSTTAAVNSIFQTDLLMSTTLFRTPRRCI